MPTKSNTRRASKSTVVSLKTKLTELDSGVNDWASPVDVQLPAGLFNENGEAHKTACVWDPNFQGGGYWMSFDMHPEDKFAKRLHQAFMGCKDVPHYLLSLIQTEIRRLSDATGIPQSLNVRHFYLMAALRVKRKDAIDRAQAMKARKALSTLVTKAEMLVTSEPTNAEVHAAKRRTHLRLVSTTA